MRNTILTLLASALAVGPLTGASPTHAAEQAAASDKAPAVKPLAEPTRKKIYWEGFSTEHKAMREANAKYPIPDPTKPGYSSEAVRKQAKANGEYSGKLIKQYDDKLIKDFGITRAQYNAIVEEGITKNWPKPVFKQ